MVIVCQCVFHDCSNIPNRSTFVCPFCGARNLDQQELVKHCMDNHRNDPNKVVRRHHTAVSPRLLARVVLIELECGSPRNNQKNP